MTNTVAENKDYRNAIVDAVCYWLGYQFKIGRDQLIHEASLRYPIADTITSKGVSIDRIVLEQLHPIFKSKKIDLVIFDEDTTKAEIEKDDTKLKEVFEFKLSKSKTGEEHSDEHQRVFDDIVRLAYYNSWGSKDCYFLMCGKYEDFKTFFVGQQTKPTTTQDDKNTVPNRHKSTIQQTIFNFTDSEAQATEWKSDGLYKDWFGFKPGEEKNIVFDNTNKDWGLKPFQDSYHVRDTTKYPYDTKIEIKTKCITITSGGLENIKTHAAGIWKIEASKDEKKE
jgi:hypothetical protein